MLRNTLNSLLLAKVMTLITASEYFSIFPTVHAGIFDNFCKVTGGKEKLFTSHFVKSDKTDFTQDYCNRDRMLQKGRD